MVRKKNPHPKRIPPAQSQQPQDPEPEEITAIPPEAFSAHVMQLLEQMEITDFNFSENSMKTLQKGSEDFISNLFYHASLVANQNETDAVTVEFLKVAIEIWEKNMMENEEEMEAEREENK